MTHRMTTDFDQALERHRRELHVHCYRMLGSVTDAEDVLQETLVAAWQGLAAFAGRSSLRSWLYRIATNRCLNARRAAARRIRPTPVPPFLTLTFSSDLASWISFCTSEEMSRLASETSRPMVGSS